MKTYKADNYGCSPNNKEFLILAKSILLFNTLANLMQIVPKKFYFLKNQILYYACDLIENITIVNSNLKDTDREKINISKDITLIQMILGYFTQTKVLSAREQDKSFKLLMEISKMSYAWLKNMDVKNES